MDFNIESGLDIYNKLFDYNIWGLGKYTMLFDYDVRLMSYKWNLDAKPVYRGAKPLHQDLDFIKMKILIRDNDDLICLFTKTLPSHKSNHSHSFWWMVGEEKTIICYYSK